ncbi:MAG: hypothetical protein WCH59_10940 [Chitinophagia bacterium]|jgi:hypothetical protein
MLFRLPSGWLIFTGMMIALSLSAISMYTLERLDISHSAFFSNTDELPYQTGQYKIYKNNQLIATLSEKSYRKFRDSIALQTKDTLFTSRDGKVVIHPFKPDAGAFNTSAKNAPPMVFTDKKGNVTLHLPNAQVYQYQVNFYESPNQILFTIQTPKEENLTLEKSNFIRSGWFDYEVLLNNELKEKGRIYLPR